MSVPRERDAFWTAVPNGMLLVGCRWWALRYKLAGGEAQAREPSRTSPLPGCGGAAQTRELGLPESRPRGGAGRCVDSEAPRALQVTVTHLCAAGPMQAVEIQVESSSLANLCQAHHAVIGRLQVHGPAQEVGVRWWEQGTVADRGCLRGCCRTILPPLCLCVFVLCR